MPKIVKINNWDLYRLSNQTVASLFGPPTFSRISNMRRAYAYRICLKHRLFIILLNLRTKLLI